jgi:hypothetical protein
MRFFDEKIFNGSGLIVGSVRSKHRALNARERKYCQMFLEKIVGGVMAERKMSAAKNVAPAKSPVPSISEECNMVWIAGKIYKHFVRDKSAFTVVQFSKGSVPVTTFDKAILRDLEKFREGDFIRFVGHVSQSKDERGDYKLMIVSSALKCEIPKHAEAEKQDEIPF